MGGVSVTPRWTPALVMSELRTAMRRPVLHAPSWAKLPEPVEAAPHLDMIARTELYLGRKSLERTAMLILAKPEHGISIREMCRVGLRWSRSRTSLYRQARRGAKIVARRLNEDGVAVPGAPVASVTTHVLTLADPVVADP